MTGHNCVVLADVVNSQKIEERERFEQKLKTAIATINKRHQEFIHTEFAVIKGVDEFGGVINSIGPVAEIQKTFSRILHPEQFRMAVVIDTIDVNKDSERISEMDGRAFARGDTILSGLERSGFRFALSGQYGYIDDLISDEINLLEIIRSNWSEKTAEIVKQYEKYDKQKEVADRLNISPQNVSYHLSKPSVELVLKIEDRLSNLLGNYQYIAK